MLASCSEALGELGLPTANAAYEEACLAPSPKAEGTWSHPIAYLAGEIRAGIYLQTILAMKLGQRFKSHYNQWLRKALAGETLTIPERKAIDAPREEGVMSNDQRKEALSALKEQLGF